MQVSTVVDAIYASDRLILHHSYPVMTFFDIALLSNTTQDVVFPCKKITFHMTFCRCPYGYVGSYCEMGKSRGPPAGTGTVIHPLSNLLRIYSLSQLS